jgi:hypothetical protein
MSGFQPGARGILGEFVSNSMVLADQPIAVDAPIWRSMPHRNKSNSSPTQEQLLAHRRNPRIDGIRRDDF